MKNLNGKNSQFQNQTAPTGEAQTRKRIKSEKTVKNDVYAKITDFIIDRLEQGYIPWINPVVNCKSQNLITGTVYKGINLLLLSCSETPFFMTFKQAMAIGAKIKKGAKSRMVVYWNSSKKLIENEETGEEEERTLYYLKYYNVFNIADIENIPEKYLEKTKIEKNNVNEIQNAEDIINNYPNPPIFKKAMGTPCYCWSNDTISTPDKDYFKNSNHYYSTLFHEIGHSTGHESRLNRHKEENTKTKFGCKSYAKEELVAELTAAFLMSEIGEALNVENETAYIQSWLSKLQNDKYMVVYAASKAEKAANYILNRDDSEKIAA